MELGKVMGDKSEAEDGRLSTASTESKRVGRPSNATRLLRERERDQSFGALVDPWKRKRDNDETVEASVTSTMSMEDEEAAVFAKCRKIARFPEEKVQDWKMEREVESLREEVRSSMSNIRAENEKLRGEINEIRNELKKNEEEWEKEKKELQEKISQLEKKLEEKERGDTETEGTNGKKEEEEKGWKERIKDMEWVMEKKEREERKANIVIKGTRVEEGKEKEAAEKLVREIGVDVEIKEVWGIKMNRRKSAKMLIVKLGNFNQKKIVMQNKKKLWGREERIEDDLTWRERKMKWTLRERAKLAGKEGNTVKIGYGKLWINGEKWDWDEKREKLVAPRTQATGKTQSGIEKETKKKEDEEDSEQAEITEEEVVYEPWKVSKGQARGRGGNFNWGRGRGKGAKRARGGGWSGRGQGQRDE